MSPAHKAPSLRHRLEYLLLQALALPLLLLPYRLALSFAWLVAAFMFHVLRFRRRETLRRIQSVFGSGITPQRARQIAWTSLRNMTFNAVEMVRIRKFSRAAIERRIFDYDATLQKLKAALGHPDRGAGGLIGIPHMGNWDLAGSACHLGGLPIFSVAARQRNPLTNSLINRLRSGHGMEILERGSGTMRQVVHRLREGYLFAILPDTRSRQRDLAIPFLGGTANLARGMASFARTANVPIIPVIMLRIGWTKFRVLVHEPVFPDSALDKTTDLQRMTLLVLSQIDLAIHQHPEQWFWYNKRWVLDPLD